MQESLIHGSLEYISKPFDHDLIKKKIEEVLKKQLRRQSKPISIN